MENFSDELVFHIYSYNQGNNIVGLFDVLPDFPFTTSETKCNIISNKHKQGVYELLHELLNDLRLRILGNKEKSGESSNLLEL